MSVIEELKENWNGRSNSDKKIIICLFFVLIVFLFYLLVVEPMQQWQELQQRKLLANYKKLPQVERLVQRYNQQGKQDSGKKRDIVGIVHESLSQHGLVMQGSETGKNNSARFSLTEVQYKPLVSWLYDIEYKHQITIEEFSLVETKKAGLLRVTLYLRN